MLLQEDAGILKIGRLEEEHPPPKHHEREKQEMDFFEKTYELQVVRKNKNLPWIGALGIWSVFSYIFLWAKLREVNTEHFIYWAGLFIVAWFFLVKFHAPYKKNLGKVTVWEANPDKYPLKVEVLNTETIRGNTYEGFRVHKDSLPSQMLKELEASKEIDLSFEEPYFYFKKNHPIVLGVKGNLNTDTKGFRLTGEQALGEFPRLFAQKSELWKAPNSLADYRLEYRVAGGQWQSASEKPVKDAGGQQQVTVLPGELLPTVVLSPEN